MVPARPHNSLGCSLTRLLIFWVIPFLKQTRRTVRETTYTVQIWIAPNDVFTWRKLPDVDPQVTYPGTCQPEPYVIASWGSASDYMCFSSQLCDTHFRSQSLTRQSQKVIGLGLFSVPGTSCQQPPFLYQSTSLIGALLVGTSTRFASAQRSALSSSPLPENNHTDHYLLAGHITS